MTPRNRRFRAFIAFRQGPHACVRETDIAHRQARIRKYPVRFREQVIDLCPTGPNFCQVTVVADVSRTDQVLIIPRNNKERPTVGSSLNIKSVRRCTRKIANHDMTALGAADQSWSIICRSSQNIIHPGPCCIDHHTRFYPLSLCCQRVPEIQRCHAASFNVDSCDGFVGQYVGSGSPGTEQVFQDETLRVSHLRIEIPHGTTQTGAGQARLRIKHGVATERFVTGNGFPNRQQVIRDHAEPNQP